jgi:hypothetical protein
MRGAWWPALALAVAACRGSGAGGGGARPASDAGAPVATQRQFIEEISVAIDFKRHTWGPFEVRRGARVPLAGFWERYAPFLGIAPSELVQSRPPRPAPVIPNAKLHDFVQMHLGYPVAGYGYSVQVLDGYVQSGLGKAMTHLPAQAPTPISRARAEAIAFDRIEPKGARPWLTEPGRWKPPTGVLAWWSGKLAPEGPDFHLVWSFHFASTGISEPGSIYVDAEDGAVLVSTPGAIR